MSGVLSGPVIAIDSKRLLVTNIRTNTDDLSDLQFFVTNDSGEKEFISEENSSSPFRSYNYKNIYLTLPNNWTTDVITEFGVWSHEKDTIVTSVLLNFSANEIRHWNGDALPEKTVSITRFSSKLMIWLILISRTIRIILREFFEYQSAANFKNNL